MNLNPGELLSPHSSSPSSEDPMIPIDIIVPNLSDVVANQRRQQGPIRMPVIPLLPPPVAPLTAAAVAPQMPKRRLSTVLTNDLLFADGRSPPRSNKIPRNGDYIHDLDRNGANTQGLFNDLRSLFPSKEVTSNNNIRANRGSDIKQLRDLLETKKLYKELGSDTTRIDVEIKKVEDRLF